MATRSQETTGKNTNLTRPNPESFFPTSLTSFNDIDRIFNDYFNRNWLRSFRPDLNRMSDLWGTYEMRSPNMDIIDREKEILVRAELPGVNKKDLDISVTDNLLVIKGISSYETKTEKEEYFSSEIKKGSFSRSIALPANVDTSKIKANFNNGLLELTIPKSSTSKKQSIKVG